MNKGIRKIFSEVPRRYELINHLLTFGMDIYSRRKAVKWAIKGGGSIWVDICSGTGETASQLKKAGGTETTVIAGDFSRPMLEEARKKENADRINFILTEAGRLPFADNSIDLITISFATRNLNTSRRELINRFNEFYRVLKPAGRFVNLETSQPPVKVIRMLMHLYVKLTVRQIGAAISGSRSGYKYLSSTIPRFYDADELSFILKESGFDNVSYRRIFFGIAAIHRAVK